MVFQMIKLSADKDLVLNAEIYRAQNYEDLKPNQKKALAELKALGNKYKIQLMQKNCSSS